MKKLILLWLILLPLQLFAAQDVYQFSDTTQQKRFSVLTNQLRCLVCQNQNLAESNSSLAGDLRSQVYEKIIQGQSDQDIIQYLVARYGDFILYEPPMSWVTLGLWFGPFLVLIFGLGYLIFYLKRGDKSLI